METSRCINQDAIRMTKWLSLRTLSRSLSLFTLSSASVLADAVAVSWLVLLLFQHRSRSAICWTNPCLMCSLTHYSHKVCMCNHLCVRIYCKNCPIFWFEENNDCSAINFDKPSAHIHRTGFPIWRRQACAIQACERTKQRRADPLW